MHLGTMGDTEMCTKGAYLRGIYTLIGTRHKYSYTPGSGGNCMSRRGKVIWLVQRVV